METLEVFHEERLVGTLAQPEDDRWFFAYSERWRSEGFPISLSLPFDEDWKPNAAQNFFSNLLPEAELRRLVCLKLGISESNDFQLLAAIGGDCAGALSVFPTPRSHRTKSEYRPITAAQLVKFAAGPGALAGVDGKNGLRLSLAGAQDKVPVYVDGDKLFLPVGAAPSSHILKFESRRFKHLPANEVLMAMLAKKLGLRTAPTQLLRSGKNTLCLIERFDRAKLGSKLERLHQEDFCQATGQPPSQKYEREGGPPFSQLVELTRRNSTEPLRDVEQLLRWLTFNVICFNADAHAKNVSLLYSERSNQKELAPFYDLICTRAYPGLSTDLAMSVGGESDPTRLHLRHWVALANSVDMKGPALIDIAKEIAEQLLDAIREVKKAFRDQFGTSPALEMVLPLLPSQAKKLIRQLKA